MITQSNSVALINWLAPRKVEWEYQNPRPASKKGKFSVSKQGKKNSENETARSKSLGLSDILALIFSKLSVRDQTSCRFVCHKWKQIVDADRFYKDRLLKRMIEIQLPPAVLQVFGSVDIILALPLFVFDARTKDLYFNNSRDPKTKNKKFYGADNVDWCAKKAPSAPVMRFVDPYGRMGFLFRVQDAKHQRLHTICLQESMPIMQRFGKIDDGHWILKVASEDTTIQQIMERRLTFDTTDKNAPKLMQGLALLAKGQSWQDTFVENDMKMECILRRFNDSSMH